MVLAWVALAWGLGVVESSSSNRMQRIFRLSKFDGKHQPGRPTADYNDVCICVFHVRNKRSLVAFLQA